MFEMKAFGSVLTGREYGKEAAKKLLKTADLSVLDFSGVVSVGSSFGDEIFKAIRTVSKSIQIAGATSMVRFSLEQSAKDHGVAVRFI